MDIWDQLLTPDGRTLVAQLTPWDDEVALPRLAALRADPHWSQRPELVSAAATQARLRTRAQARFPGPPRWWTAAGLEQATRPALAARHARRLAAAGVTAVADLGCGAGSDSLAFAAAGLAVTAVDRDPDALAALHATAADLGLAAEDQHQSDPATAPNPAPGQVATCQADLTDFVAALRDPGPALFLDPSRRSGGTRRLHPQSWSPPWSWVCELAASHPAVGAKVAPGIPHDAIPATASAQWVSQAGDLLEAGVWWGALRDQSGRSAVVLAGDGQPVGCLDDRGGIPTPRIGGVGQWLVEPDPAVIRSGLVSVLAAQLDGWLLDPHIAYICGCGAPPGLAALSGLGTAYQVLAEVPVARKALRAWLRQQDVGRVVVKKRGLDLDPAQLIRSLRLPGTGAEMTLVLTRTAAGPLGLAVSRSG